MISNEKFAIDPEYLQSLAIRYREAYSKAQPFPHVVIDNFLPENLLDSILNEFPDPSSVDWQKFDNTSEKKLASTSELHMGEATRNLLYKLNSSTFISFLEMLTGIDGLVPDPHFVGGGLHQIESGGYLKMHVDFNKHQKLRLDRRLNLLLYLNKNWSEDYGGHLEFWDKDITRCEKKILPVFNRCVVFNTTDFSYHGHPEPLTCPEGQTRKSLALYYYSNGRPAEEVFNTHSTLFQGRPGEQLQQENYSEIDFKTIFKKLVPPIFVDAKNYFRKS
ncbi:MAG: proline hydroxylase [Cyanobacteria bacterium QH_8_48_120]|jgi:Rps23 Pro-64 3,4-dihydroxylase Tpa1-like proline 4-hydroxylase|nr:MAG: proline hydroxylase [Cyanobacteria bacterium QH_1_48_107]PSO56806.1 MAG: proline hydroxylase [Cyanobacteria bacterium QH_10_48_56]PSO65560.1 MAG: proline hydroxylase [Cyanobacteria bacterium QH_6_48_35]PSO72540.1 MAG: proline hydroxylase [Cyanobacteria bacterium QH_8_48_120]